ncbi:MAG: hypothetical protein R3247_16495 [Rhodothermales bacterium]|nr:hypothetical protein [Rhodothermales bacterium]
MATPLLSSMWISRLRPPHVGGLLLGVAVLLTSVPCAAQGAPPEDQIAGALLPAPEALRAGATVLGYDAVGALVTLREGTNDLICLADLPGDDRFHAACYHAALEPYMARGRELKAQGVDAQESFRIRHAEADAGTLPMPSEPAAVYNVALSLETFDPATATVTLYAVYMPYATQSSTGLPERPGPPGTPWIMRPGTASAHIMLVPPRQ